MELDSDFVVIPLGEECYTCGSIDKKLSGNNFRNCGFPFDYVAGTSVSNVYNNLYNMFINDECILKETDFCSKYISEYAPEKKYYLVHKKYGFIYWHDVGSDSDTFENKDMQSFLEKYNRRYFRLKHTIENSKQIAFLSVNHFCNVFNKNYKKNEIIKLYDFLFQINKNIKFIAINFCDENEKYNNLEFVNLNVNRDVDISESKKLFKEDLNKFVSKRFSSI